MYDSLEDQNVLKGKKAGKLDIAIAERKTIFDGQGGLRDRMKAIKNAVRAQYGNKSKEYGIVKGIKL